MNTRELRYLAELVRRDGDKDLQSELGISDPSTLAREFLRLAQKIDSDRESYRVPVMADCLAIEPTRICPGCGGIGRDSGLCVSCHRKYYIGGRGSST